MFQQLQVRLAIHSTTSPSLPGVTFGKLRFAIRPSLLHVQVRVEILRACRMTSSTSYRLGLWADQSRSGSSSSSTGFRRHYWEVATFAAFFLQMRCGMMDYQHFVVDWFIYRLRLVFASTGQLLAFWVIHLDRSVQVRRILRSSTPWFASGQEIAFVSAFDLCFSSAIVNCSCLLHGPSKLALPTPRRWQAIGLPWLSECLARLEL